MDLYIYLLIYIILHIFWNRWISRRRHAIHACFNPRNSAENDFVFLLFFPLMMHAFLGIRRRIHFEIYRAEQLVVLINLDIVPGGSTQCVNKCIELLNHRCIEVRKQAAGSASEIIMVLGQNTPEAEQLKNVVIGLSGSDFSPSLPCFHTLFCKSQVFDFHLHLAGAEGTCRMKQTFIWAAEQMRNCNMDYFTRHFYAPLKQVCYARLTGDRYARLTGDRAARRPHCPTGLRSIRRR